MDPKERQYIVLCRVYEMKLKELLTENEYNALQAKAFRMMQIDDLQSRNPKDDFTKFLHDLINPTEADYEEHAKLKLSTFKL